MKKAVFFDRDGIVNYRIVGDYVKSNNEFHFIPDFFQFFMYVKQHDYLTIIISNQQGVGKGLMGIDDLSEIHNKMQTVIAEKTGYCFDDIFVCSDLQESGSFMRKPNPGMILEAVEKWGIDKTQSYIIGDSRSDIEAGKNASIGTILIKPFYVFDTCNSDLYFDSLSDINIL